MTSLSEFCAAIGNIASICVKVPNSAYVYSGLGLNSKFRLSAFLPTETPSLLCYSNSIYFLRLMNLIANKLFISMSLKRLEWELYSQCFVVEVLFAQCTE